MMGSGPGVRAKGEFRSPLSSTRGIRNYRDRLGDFGFIYPIARTISGTRRGRAIARESKLPVM